MFHHLSLAVVLPFLSACSEAKAPESSALLPDAGLVVTTVAADYTVGALAMLDPDDRSLYDDLSSLSSDPGVSVDDGVVYQVNRLGFDNVRVYQPGDWSVPALEFSTGTGSNPQRVQRCLDRLFVALHDAAALGIYDPETGVRLGEVPLGAYADADGIPEMGSLLEREGRLWLALQRLDRNNGWVSDTGMVVEIDCESETILQDYVVGPSPTLAWDPGGTDALLVRTGIYYDPDGAPLLDGGIFSMNLDSGDLTPLLTEADYGQNLTGIASTPDRDVVMVVSSDADAIYSVLCLDRATLSLRVAETTPSFITASLISPTGEAWVATRPSWNDPEAPGVLRSYDPDSCAATGEPVRTTLPPYDLAWL